MCLISETIVIMRFGEQIGGGFLRPFVRTANASSSAQFLHWTAQQHLNVSCGFWSRQLRGVVYRLHIDRITYTHLANAQHQHQHTPHLAVSVVQTHSLHNRRRPTFCQTPAAVCCGCVWCAECTFSVMCAVLGVHTFTLTTMLLCCTHNCDDVGDDDADGAIQA